MNAVETFVAYHIICIVVKMSKVLGNGYIWSRYVVIVRNPSPPTHYSRGGGERLVKEGAVTNDPAKSKQLRNTDNDLDHHISGCTRIFMEIDLGKILNVNL